MYNNEGGRGLTNTVHKYKLHLANIDCIVLTEAQCVEICTAMRLEFIANAAIMPIRSDVILFDFVRRFLNQVKHLKKLLL